MGELEKLIEAVEAGVDAPWRLTPFELRDHVETIGFAFGGDLNAAKALHEALLPGWEVCSDTPSCMGLVWPSGQPEGAFRGGDEDFTVNNPDRAWLMAILKAYRSLQ